MSVTATARRRPGLGTWLRFARFNQVFRDWGHVVIVVIWAAARPPASTQTLFAALGCLLTVAFAHMLNDWVDARDDARDPTKRRANMVASGALPATAARRGMWLTGALALLCFLPLPPLAQIAGLSVWGAGLCYSLPRIRWKGRPIVDLLSHGWGAAPGMILAFACLDGATFDRVTLFAMAGTGLFSIGGCFYNQLRDWDVDRLAGLRNTSSIIGRRNARVALILSFAAGTPLLVSGAIELARLVDPGRGA